MAIKNFALVSSDCYDLDVDICRLKDINRIIFADSSYRYFRCVVGLLW